MNTTKWNTRDADRDNRGIARNDTAACCQRGLLRTKSHLATLSLICCVGAQSATAAIVDFEGFTPGSVNGQGGWTVEDEFGNSVNAFDQEVTDDGSGNNVWRLSNAHTSGGFSDQPNSHTAPAVAGESGSALWNDRGSNHTAPLNPPNPGATPTTDSFHAQFSFRSATGGAQPGLQTSVSPIAKQSAFRNGYVSIADNGATGFEIGFYETGIAASPFGPTAVSQTLASSLAYDQWHTIDLYIDFEDGLNLDTTGNDIVHILVNGALAFTGSTWESYYAGGNPGNLNPANQPHRQAVDSLLFAARGTAAPTTDGAGFFFDNVIVDNERYVGQSVPDANNAAMLLIVALGALAVARPTLGRA